MPESMLKRKYQEGKIRMGNKYLIKEAAKLVDVEPHVLRYWEEELDMRIKRNDMGHTDFMMSRTSES